MGMLALAVAGLLLGQAPSDVVYTNQRGMNVPITLDDSLRANFREFLLFASWDQGASYQQVASVRPDSKAFTFEARNDGLCWLRVAGVNRQGKQEPDNVPNARPNLKIVIDTLKPVM